MANSIFNDTIFIYDGEFTETNLIDQIANPGLGYESINVDKVECVFPMVILSDFRMGQHKDDCHQEDAPHFIDRVIY